MDPHNLGILEVARALQIHAIQHGLSSYQYGAVPISKARLLCPQKKWWPPEVRDIYLCNIYPQFDYPLTTVFACLAAVFGGQCAIYVHVSPMKWLDILLYHYPRIYRLGWKLRGPQGANIGRIVHRERSVLIPW